MFRQSKVISLFLLSTLSAVAKARHNEFVVRIHSCSYYAMTIESLNQSYVLFRSNLRYCFLFSFFLRYFLFVTHWFINVIDAGRSRRGGSLHLPAALHVYFGSRLA